MEFHRYSLQLRTDRKNVTMYINRGLEKHTLEKQLVFSKLPLPFRKLYIGCILHGFQLSLTFLGIFIVCAWNGYFYRFCSPYSNLSPQTSCTIAWYLLLLSNKIFISKL